MIGPHCCCCGCLDCFLDELRTRNGKINDNKEAYVPKRVGQGKQKMELLDEDLVRASSVNAKVKMCIDFFHSLILFDLN